MNDTHYDFSSQSAARQADTLFDAVLALHQDTGHPLYLLFDPVLRMDNIDIPLIQALLKQKPVPVPLPHKNLSEPDYPWLIYLDPEQEECRILLRLSITTALAELHPDNLEQGLGRALCGWLTSPAKPEELIKQLGHTAVQRVGINRHILMRYYDPAVHSLLWGHLSELQQRRMGGLLSGWLAVDGDGQMMKRRFQPAPMMYSTFSLGLNDEQCEFILTTCGVTNCVLRRYRQMNIDEARYPEQTAASYILQALTRQAGHPALQRPEDKERFALQVLHYHPQIDQHPRVAELLDHDTFSDDVTWVKRSLTIPPETWQRYADELTESQTMENNA